VPTLVIQRDDDRIMRAAAGRHLAQHIPRATYLRLPGADHWRWHGDADAVVQAIEHFVARS
jgi:pimeloyl-ACP methyl ester carboxylesterase